MDRGPEYLPRHVEARIRRLAEGFPVLLLTGARQVGKSTLLSHVFGGRARTFVFDPVQDVGRAREDPELFLRLNPPPLILDEIQYAPQLLPALKRLVDERRGEPGLYFLTGSHQFSVLRGARESLAGRVGIVDLLPMSALELGGADGPGLAGQILDGGDLPAEALAARLAEAAGSNADEPGILQRIFRGGYPGLRRFADPDLPDWFASYFRTYLERDVRSLREVRQPEEFARLARVLAALTAQELNSVQLGRELGITRQTARAWLGLLSGGYQVEILDAWSGNTIKRVSSRPKVHWADTGLACWLLSVSSPDALNAQPNLGSLFESWVVGELRRQAQALASRPQVWHWRSHGGAEVDLLLERDGRLHPIEIKLKSRPTRRDARGLAAFADAYPGQRLGPRLLVHGGPDLELLDERTVAVPARLLWQVG